MYLTEILKYKAKTILTCIENNIKEHFFSYVKRYVNIYFLDLYKDDIDNKIITEKDLKKELYLVKNDLINNTKTSLPKYHDWLDDNRDNIFPDISHKSEDEQNPYFDVKVAPQTYLKHMIWMSQEIEKQGKKMFQIFPLQNNIIPKHITICTTVLIELFERTNTLELRQNVFEKAYDIWDKYFIRKKFKYSKKYVFNDEIMTDGYSCTSLFVRPDIREEERIKHENSRNTKLLMKDMTDIEKKEFKKRREAENKEKQKQKIKEKITCICGHIGTKGSYSSHKKSVKHKKFLTDNDLTDDGYIEFPYITEIERDELKELKPVFCDPGKRDYLHLWREMIN
jgi:hypothetical protein